MGRVAKFKKVKKTVSAVDSDGIWGFGDNGVKPKKRSRTSEKLRAQKMNRKLKKMKDNPNYNKQQKQQFGSRNRDFNCPPSDNEDDFDLRDIVGTIKKQKQQNPSSLLHNDDDYNIPTVKSTSAVKSTSMETIDRKEIKESTQLLKNDSAIVDAGTTTSSTSTSATTTATTKKHEGRRANESKSAYMRRIKEETTTIIKQTKMNELNPEKRQRKKDFLNQKKKRKRGGGGGGGGGGRANANDNNHNKNDDDDDDYLAKRRHHHHAVVDDEVPFGHQVERPPEFKSLPRGAISKRKTNNHQKTSSMKTDQDVRSEQENLEKMRQKVQEQYAIIKAKRKRAGDFHL